jgi:hypothetical protein
VAGRNRRLVVMRDVEGSNRRCGPLGSTSGCLQTAVVFDYSQTRSAYAVLGLLWCETLVDELVDETRS